MRAFVGITDGDWYRFLRGHPDIDEVNFWQPSGRTNFRALSPGEPFLFKLHTPERAIVGGAFFAHSSILPYRMAWDFFGEKNGAATLGEMRARIERYRKVPPNPFEDYPIGCVILSAPFFFNEDEWIPEPEGWKPNIVRGRGYDLVEDQVGRDLWQAVLLRAGTPALQPGVVSEPAPDPAGSGSVPGPLFGKPVAMRPRLGQGAFRSLITDTYQRRCAVTGEQALPVLEAAHVMPLSEGGQHRVDNGLLLRSDIHRLYDRGYVTVTPDLTFRVSRRLKDEFDNGEPYYPLEKRRVWVPARELERPSLEFLEWHSDTLFRA